MFLYDSAKTGTSIRLKAIFKCDIKKKVGYIF